MADSFHQQPETVPHTPYAVACAAVEFLGDQWGALPGPWGVTGHLHNADHIPFTVGVCEAGDLYIRNDLQGDSRHLRFRSTADITLIGRTIAAVIGDLY
ncbi:hypothetical protein KBP30_41585 [Streptomyces sp. Go40/10]|uniref:hypothetical protein n=1 Tax=Streptomyces sp. Go40/10 TaxID=2825844 RepID=UPI001E5287E5|nr:hypothetical protein [Streptomyces sp. Go40/10]UFQ99721.1 hypothetical protein KBP30_00020 [Streptomyces sp. Go40/10]UFR07225.1 hypothetical protein KBP30_41585 [Streptomyces sp. Go40/10]